MGQADNHHIFGILYQQKDGAIFLLNDAGAHRVFIEPPESLLLPAASIHVRETSTVMWNSGEKETWDSKILEDLLHDMEEEGRDAKNEMTYENEHCSSIIISST